MTIIDLVDNNAKKYSAREALWDSNKSYTFRELREKGESAAACFQKWGVKKGDPVALMSQNTADFVFSFFGILKAGGIVVPINHKLTTTEVEYILKDSDTKLFLFDGTLKDIALSITRDIKKIAIDTPAENFTSLQDAMAEGISFKPVSVDDKDSAEILYTSGTTGKPKGCVHTHESVIAAGITGVKCVDFTDRDRTLIAMPIWHSSPLNNWFMGTTLVGGAVVLLREYHPLFFLQIIEQQKCSVYFGAPISYLMPLQVVENFDQFNLSSMRAWIYGGGPIAPETVRRLVKNYKSDKFYQVYGMTEAGPSGTVLTPEDHEKKAGAIGNKPLPGASIKIMKDSSTMANPGETGEIWLKAASMMKEYLDNAQATEAAFHDGWYCTGDVVRIDDDGYWYIVDRIKDIIVTGGENVYSKEVEDAIAGHQDVNEVAVVGFPHPDWGETITAMIVPQKDKELTKKELDDFLSNRLAKFKTPKKYFFVEELPHTPSGKVMKYKLRQKTIKD
ncbi:MAG: AMP-binding protein [Thermodesulfobacteriota bacterium]|nr:AMP-binding protein [Thermodesulfobacteriota bacterium]